MDLFTWTLLGTVPVLYGLFWWLDYRWLARERRREISVEALPEED